MKPIVFIDGAEGTTGLQIHQRLAGREDMTLVRIDPEKRKDTNERKKLLNACDLAVLCLPDEAAVEAVSLIDNPAVKVLDASTAHRCNDAWVYGLPELTAFQADRIRMAQRVANPGCYPTGFLALVAPLVTVGLIHAGMALTCFGLSGYTGAGKKGIALYEDNNRNPMLDAPRPYGLDFQHKHVAEMHRHSELLLAPSFTPIVCDFPQGMQICVPLYGVFPEYVLQTLAQHYEGCAKVKVRLVGTEQFSANKLAGSDDMELYVTGSGERTMLMALYDNLGKGAAGAAVQNLELMLGL
jgi:N-acetyl-gamma-glutamyl-phosphate reductase, uncommon form